MRPGFTITEAELPQCDDCGTPDSLLRVGTGDNVAYCCAECIGIRQAEAYEAAERRQTA